MARNDQGKDARGAAPVVLPLAATGLLSVGALVALTSGAIGPTTVLVLTCIIVALTAILGTSRHSP